MQLIQGNFVLLFLLASSLSSVARGQTVCANQNFVPCHPEGAKSIETPDIEDHPAVVFTNLMESVCTKDPVQSKKVSQDPKLALCCHSGSECRLLSKYNVPFCFDRSTTEFAFADGSTGYLKSGQYTDVFGDSINLITGDYKLVEGDSGNVFKDDETKDTPVKTPVSFDPRCGGKANEDKERNPKKNGAESLGKPGVMSLISSLVFARLVGLVL
ncbi:MAG: hypothetical protein M1837_000592 [Sclerophora amabilis]|nr:MAG: hypothetical protein M1837_000592 [Sclerophora amabilis]